MDKLNRILSGAGDSFDFWCAEEEKGQESLIPSGLVFTSHYTGPPEDSSVDDATFRHRHGVSRAHLQLARELGMSTLWAYENRDVTLSHLRLLATPREPTAEEAMTGTTKEIETAAAYYRDYDFTRMRQVTTGINSMRRYFSTGGTMTVEKATHLYVIITGRAWGQIVHSRSIEDSVENKLHLFSADSDLSTVIGYVEGRDNQLVAGYGEGFVCIYVFPQGGSQEGERSPIVYLYNENSSYRVYYM